MELLFIMLLDATMLCVEDELGETRSVGEDLFDPKPFANDAIKDDGSGGLLVSAGGSNPFRSRPDSSCFICEVINST